MSAYGKEHYQKNKQPYLDRAKEQRRERVQWLQAYKAERGCCQCSEKRPWCLAFHHLEPEHKDVGIAEAIAAKSRDAVLEEISKCVLVCHNCHADIHHNLHMEAL